MKTRIGLELGFYNNVYEAPLFMKNFLDNGNKYIMGLVLLKNSQNQEGGISGLHLEYLPASRQGLRYAVGKLINANEELLIKTNIADIFLYSRRAVLNSCGFFKRIISDSDNGNILKIATE